jgi:hypothetical protein
MASTTQASWPTCDVPNWLMRETADLALELGPSHPDVVFFRQQVLTFGVIDEACLDRVTAFIEKAQTRTATNMAIRLSTECIKAGAAVAAHHDDNSGPHTFSCGRRSLTDAFPQPCRNRTEALGIAAAMLRSPVCPTDIWLRIQGPDGVDWDTRKIREILATRSELGLSP